MTDRISRALLTTTAIAALLFAALPAQAQSGGEKAAEADAAEDAARDVESEATRAAEEASAETSEDESEDDAADEATPDEAGDSSAEADRKTAASGDDGDDGGSDTDAASAEGGSDSDIEPETQDIEVDKKVEKRSVETHVAVDVNPEPTIFITGNREAEQDEDAETPAWRVGLSGYIRTQFTAIEDDPGTNFGRNDGFVLADARLGVHGQSKHGLGFKLQIDAGTARPSGDANDPTGEVVTRLTDGYLFYAPHPLLRVSAGQFEPPFDLEELISTSSILFVERSVGSRGVKNVEGPNRDGLSRTREVGLRVDSAPYYFTADDPAEPEGIGVSYGLAVTNGQTVNRTLNDNDKLAYTGRATLHWDKYVQVGGAVYQNDRTLGTPPDQIGESRLGWTADVLAQYKGAVLFASIIQTDISPAAELTDEDPVTARAYQAQLAWRDPFIGVGPTYRFAYYDGDIDRSGTDSPRQYEALTYHTFGIIADPWDYPVRLLANYTITDEEVTPVDNNRFDAVVQLTW